MSTSSQVVNHDGELWAVSHDESPLLTTIGGYLMMANGIGLITVSTHLSPDEQVVVRRALLRRLSDEPVSTVRTVYWSPNTEGQETLGR